MQTIKIFSYRFDLMRGILARTMRADDDYVGVNVDKHVDEHPSDHLMNH